MRQQASVDGKEAVFINLDETNVSLCFPDAKGMVVQPKHWPAGQAPKQSILRNTRRSAITHVGFITHRSDVQGKLPHIFIGDRRCFPTTLLEAVAVEIPSNIKLWQRTSSWNSSEIMLDILTDVSIAMSCFLTAQTILALDVAPIHIGAAVAEKARSLNIWLVFVSAKCTWLLQPLDTHVFSP